MMPSKIFRTTDLATLHHDKITVRRQTASCNMIEYVIRYDKTGNHPERYEVRAVGINRNGVPFTASAMECTKGRYFFQCDTNDTYSQASKNPDLLYTDRLLALAVKKKQQLKQT